jgi:hypothetical protein
VRFVSFALQLCGIQYQRRLKEERGRLYFWDSGLDEEPPSRRSLPDVPALDLQFCRRRSFCESGRLVGRLFLFQITLIFVTRESCQILLVGVSDNFC